MNKIDELRGITNKTLFNNRLKRNKGKIDVIERIKAVYKEAQIELKERGLSSE